MADCRRRRGVIVAVVLVSAACVAAASASFLAAPPRVEQPLRFSHATHVEGEGLECLECHADAATEPWAGLPDIGSCYECHKSPQGDDPDEAKVREYGKQKRQIPFVQVTRNAGHVYFSHRMHVTAAEMECESCHPGHGTLEGGALAPNPELLSMTACMNCHDEHGATNECVVCHK